MSMIARIQTALSNYSEAVAARKEAEARLYAQCDDTARAAEYTTLQACREAVDSASKEVDDILAIAQRAGVVQFAPRRTRKQDY